MRWRLSPDRDSLARDAAGALLEAIGLALREDSRAAVAAAGGSTPGPIYDRLARVEMDWPRVTVTLTDERWVEEGSPLANASLLRERLLVGPAARARFVGLKADASTLQAGAATADRRLRSLAPFAAVLLGMGEDGHVASLFPGAPELACGLETDGDRFCLPVPVARLDPFVPRLTLTLAALCATPALFLLVTGAAKRALLERVEAGEQPDPPVAAVLRQTRAPVTIFWAN